MTSNARSEETAGAKRSKKMPSGAADRPEFAQLKAAFEDAFHIPFATLPIPDCRIMTLDPLLLASRGTNIGVVHNEFCRYMNSRDSRSSAKTSRASAPRSASQEPRAGKRPRRKKMFLVGFWGHGFNSYAFEYDHIDDRRLIHLRLAYGGAFMDNEKEARLIGWFLPRFFKLAEATLKDGLKLIAIEDMGDGELRIETDYGEPLMLIGRDWVRQLGALAQVLA